MATFRTLALLVLLTLYSSVVVAQQHEARPELLQAPEGLILTPTSDTGAPTLFRPKAEYKLFNLDEWVVMGHILTDYQYLWYYAGQLELKVTLLEKQEANLIDQNKLYAQQLKVTDSAVKKMSTLLDVEQKQRIDEARAKNATAWILGATTLVAIIAASIFGGLYAAEKIN